MRWPWQKIETRAVNATQSLIDLIRRRYAASGDPVSAASLGASVFAADLLGRLAGSAKIEGLPPGVTLGPAFLSRVVRTLVLEGESCWAMLPGPSGLVLVEAGAIDVQGQGADPDSWIYNLDLPAPDGHLTGYYGADAVLHFKWSVDRNEPWRGVGPLQAGWATADLAASLTELLRDEIGAPRGSFLPVPRDPETSISRIMQDVASADGGIVSVESQRGSGFVTDERAPASTDWKTSRFGPNPPVELVQLCNSLYLEIGQLCGVPAALMSAESQGDTSTAGRRRLLTDTLQPLGIRITDEMSEKLESTVSLDWSAAQVVDVVGRARAYGSLTAAGMPADQAANYAFG